MSRDAHPLKLWLLRQGYGDHETGVISTDEFDRFAANYARKSTLTDPPTGESWRLVAYGYRKPSWDLAFDIEVVTLGELCAHDLRDDDFYGVSAA
jgi:hypothetical protein